jgi:hypothetical protein
MISGFATLACPQSATKRIVIYWAGVSFAFLAAVFFGFHGKLQAPKNSAGEHGISALAGAVQHRLVASYGKLPLSFEFNQGQTDRQVKILSRGRGYSLFLTGDAAVLELQGSGFRIQDSGPRAKPFRARSALQRTTDHGQRTTDHGLRTTDNGPRTTGSILRMELVGANVKAAVTGAEELPGKSNYFIGNDPKKWRTNVPTYAKVRYENVYPGIDLVYYGNQGGELEYDFVVAPGADPGAISLALDAGGGVGSRQKALGSRQFKIDSNGDLVVRTDGSGEVRFHKPVVYQEQSTVDSSQSTAQDGRRESKFVNRQSTIVNRQFREGRFHLTANNQVTFEVSGYDKTRPLVIDPVLAYSTYLGGDYYDSGSGIAVDSSGNAYVTGYTYSSDFPTANPLQASLNGKENAFVSKLNSTGSALAYSTYLGGSGSDAGNGIAVDSAGNAYVAGSTSSTDFPTVNPLQGTSCGGGFVSKLNATGSALVYSTCINNVGTSGIAVDSSANAYVAGGCVAKLNASGSALVYSACISGGTADAIAVDSFGNAYVTGYTASSALTTVNPLQASLHGNQNAFVSKMNASGSALVYSTYLGGSDTDGASAIAVDSFGNAYVAGYTNSADFPTVNPLQASIDGGKSCPSGLVGPPTTCNDAFVAKLNASGSALVYSTFLGGAFDDEAYGVAVDSSGNAYVVGVTASTDFPTVNPVQATNNAGLPHAGLHADTTFAAELNASGSALIYSTYLGGSKWDHASGVAVDSVGNAYVTGNTWSNDFPTVNPFQATDPTSSMFQSGNFGPAFVAQLSPGPAPAVSFSTPALSFAPASTTSPPQSVTVTNLGNAPLSITGITASGDFALVTTATSCPYGGGTVAAEANCTIDVAFTPMATGVRTGTVTVADNASGSPHTVQLSGTGTESPPRVSPTVLSFNSQSLGSTSTPQPVTVTNTSSVVLTISSLTISSAWTESNNCLPSVGSNGSCTINVSFQPTAGGYQTGLLMLMDNATNGSQTVTLSGTGTGPGASLSASSVDFMYGQLVGTTSGPEPVTLQNPGNQALNISSISLGGVNSGDFSLSQTCGSSLAANASCQISVTFTPTARGTRTATVSLVDNGPGSPQLITLTGTGIAPVANLSPSSLTFPGQFVGTTGLPENITLSNNGDLPLNISSIQASAQFGASNGCTSSLAVGVNCTISVFFDPSTAGSQTGTLTITDNAPGSPQTVQLSGTGMDFAMSSSASSATVTAGQQATYPLTLAPLGGLNQTVNLTCNGAPSLSTCTVTPGSVTLNGATPTQVSVAVSTTAGTLAPPWERVVPPSPKGLGAMFWLYGLLGLASLAGLAGAGKRRAAYLLGACLLMVMLWSACGGGAQVIHTPGTPPGTYTVDVTATVTSATTSSTLTHDFKFTLTVD